MVQDLWHMPDYDMIIYNDHHETKIHKIDQNTITGHHAACLIMPYNHTESYILHKTSDILCPYISFTVQMWHWLVDEKLIGSKECHDLRPSLTRHLTSTSCTGKQKQACATPSWPSRWRMISAKVVHFKLSSHKVSGTNTNKHDTCNKNKSQSQHISSHISTHLHKFSPGFGRKSPSLRFFQFFKVHLLQQTSNRSHCK